MVGLLLGFSSAFAIECPEGWMDRGCPPGVQPQNGCCPTRAFCEGELAIERRRAARRHLGERYDQAEARYTDAWNEASATARQCVESLDLPMCEPAREQLSAYLRRPSTFKLRVGGGNDTVQTSCGEERVFFNGDSVTFDVPHRDEAQVTLQAVRDLESEILGRGQRPKPKPEFRPAGAPPAKSSNLPAGVPASSSGVAGGVTFGQFYTTTEQAGPILDALRTFEGRFEACYQKIHPGWRMAPAELVMTWETSAGRAARIQFPHDGMGHPELRSCLQGVLANVPMSSIRDGRSSVVLTVASR